MPSFAATILGVFALAASSVCSPTHHSGHDLVVTTDVFTVQGALWPNSTDVHFFGNIPYAEPPIGELRFRPPVSRASSTDVINGSWFGPSCIQYSSGEQTVYTEHLKGFTLAPGQTQDEDCLTVNVWAPKKAKQGDKLPVMIWIHGGGHTSGGAASPYKYGHRLARDQNVIVVAMNYRLNIFGYPAAAALDGKNLNPGLLDQRKAVEWTYNNIYAFGGDPAQMVLFGQSAGGQSVDMYSYAYPYDPLVKGFIAQSGVAMSGAAPSISNFLYVAQQVGCGNATNEDAELACMQRADAKAIIAVYNEYNSSQNGGLSLSFSTVADNQTRFSNYTDLQARGLFARRPIVYAQVNNEGNSLVDYNEAGINRTAADIFTANFATCPGDAAAAAKSAFNIPVWRTRYFGVWPNLNPLPWLGSYHSSDIPMVFGTSDLLGPDTTAEDAVSRLMQGAWAAFARDPEKGLTNYGWPVYSAEGETLIELARNGSATPIFVATNTYENQCR